MTEEFKYEVDADRYDMYKYMLLDALNYKSDHCAPKYEEQWCYITCKLISEYFSPRSVEEARIRRMKEEKHGI